MTDVEILREAARQIRAADGELADLIDRLTDAPEVGDNAAAFGLRRCRRMLPAVADWLDGAADREAAYRDCEPHAGQPEPGEEAYGALIVARAYMGGAS